jgi:hypothetical protein
VEFAQSKSPHVSANNSLQRRPVAIPRATILRERRNDAPCPPPFLSP